MYITVMLASDYINLFTALTLQLLSCDVHTVLVTRLNNNLHVLKEFQ